MHPIAAKASEWPSDGPDAEDDEKYHTTSERPSEGLAGALEGMERLRREERGRQKCMKATKRM